MRGDLDEYSFVAVSTASELTTLEREKPYHNQVFETYHNILHVNKHNYYTQQLRKVGLEYGTQKVFQFSLL